MADIAVQSGALAPVSGHFGEWLQGRLGPKGPLVLITLCCPALTVRVAPGTEGDVPAFTEAQLSEFRAVLGLPPGDWPALLRDMPLGAGAGGSTATLVALARGAGFSGTPQALATACLHVEGATDPLMFPHPDRLLWASRRATALEDMPPPPDCDILGGYWGATQATTPEDEDFPDVADLVTDWRDAAQASDLGRTAALASESAQRTTALRGPLDPMPELALTLGALGHIRAHTGSARGLVFAPGTVPTSAGAALTEAGLDGVFQFRTGGT